MNRERKDKFIDEIFDAGWKVTPSTKEIRLASRVFDIIEGYEEAWDCDVAEQSLGTLNILIREIGDKISSDFDGNQNLAKLSVAKILYLYSKWCRSNKIKATPDITRCHYARVAKAATWVIKSPFYLQELLDSVSLPDHTESVDLFRRGVAWLAYAGMLRSEIVSVNFDNFDEQKMTVKCKTDGDYLVYKLPEESKVCMRLLAQNDTFINYSSNEGAKRTPRVLGTALVRPPVKGRHWSKELKNDDWQSRNIKNPVPFINNALGRLQKRSMWRDLSYTALYKNGFYYRAWLEESALPERKRLVPGVDVTQGPVKIYEWMHISELDKMVANYLANPKATNNHVDRKRELTEWRRKLYNDYLLWRWVAYDNCK